VVAPSNSRPSLWLLFWFGVGVVVSIPEVLAITGLLIGPPPGTDRLLPAHARALGVALVGVTLAVSFGLGFGLGRRDGRQQIALADARWRVTALVGVAGIGGWAGYGAGQCLARPAVGGGRGGRGVKTVTPAFDQLSAAEQVITAPDPYAQLRGVAAAGYGLPGGHAGWADDGGDVSANPRGGLLVIGPPGSGKTSAVIIPSVLVAPAALVCSSIKGDVMAATAGLRTRLGRVWHIDPRRRRTPRPRGEPGALVPVGGHP